MNLSEVNSEVSHLNEAAKRLELWGYETARTARLLNSEVSDLPQAAEMYRHEAAKSVQFGSFKRIPSCL